MIDFFVCDILCLKEVISQKKTIDDSEEKDYDTLNQQPVVSKSRLYLKIIFSIYLNFFRLFFT